jgi:metallophosphoesterase (TIGR00282 family)
MKILMAGDIVGSSGRTAFARVVAGMRRAKKVDFVIVNAENAAAGKGLTERLAEEILAAGADVITLGDHTWDQKEAGRMLERQERVIRPANFASSCPGRGILSVEINGISVTVMNLVGRVFMNATDCPFRTADKLLADKDVARKVVVVDFHAEATSEKIAMGRYLDGRVSGVVGTHTHVQTSDDTILPKGTAYLTDLGMTGPKDSIIGCDVESVMPVFLTGMRSRFEVARDNDSAVLEGALITVDEQTGRARSIKRIRE